MVLLVIGAGPYGVATAAAAIGHGIETVVVGRPMGFWTHNMPAGMFLRSGPDWHLDAAGVHTFDAFLEERAISPEEVDPVPIDVFLAYAAWFQDQTGVVVRDELVRVLTRDHSGFRAELDSGDVLVADAVVAAPGIRAFQRVPSWSHSVPPGVAAHTCELIDFDAAHGARVLIVGGRQSAYEWAALFGEHGAERVDIVHRHPVPRFDRVSWKFVDPHIDATLAVPGWWRKLPSAAREAIERQFWEVGRLTLEWWLTPRLTGDRFHRWPECAVAGTTTAASGTRVTLSNGEELEVDHIVYATGYKADLTKVSYLSGVIEDVELDDGFPRLDDGFQSSVPGLYIPGFSATRDFGPFFGFTRGCPAAAAVIVDRLERAAGRS
jgi:cation diffusion facilitator CzcD-associated flavoprotein CzcO